ncbi:MAG: aspartate kinase [Bacteroidetes bacterium]|nr:aspartate kinase [Bacteroidota bacterium]
MKVFKFGGASVKDADAVRNVAKILGRFSGENIVVIISAMGKTTNALERLAYAFFYGKENATEILAEIKDFHWKIARELFGSEDHTFFTELHNAFVELEWAVDGKPEHSFDHEYDQVVSIGEILSTKIISAYLSSAGVKNKWLDVRDVVKTDNTFREGKVDWAFTEECAKKCVAGFFSHGKEQVIITQGFIACTSENFTTTLGREGSDYTSAILAYCLNAESVTIWKDVPGVLNADPKWFDETQLISELTYQDAIELTYYGATVIHPKTIKPLQNKNIPLFVRSFLEPEKTGTKIHDAHVPLPVPCFIFKVNQVLLSISPKDFSFIVEENLSEIFNMFASHRIKMNVMLNSAISFSVSVDGDERKLPELIKELREKFRVLYNENVELVTIRYYDQPTIDRVTAGKRIFLEVKSRYTVQIVMKDLNEK